ncbi:MAG: 5-(carboxyamino)imidazole ribonucleotide synthase [Phycisphaerales bacterium]
MTGHLAVLGGGQLGRMIALAAAPLGLRTRLLDPSPDACAARVAPMITGRFDDPAALARLLDGAAAATIEFENIPTAALDAARDRGVDPAPGVESLRISADRLLEKQHLGSLGIAVAPFAPVRDEHSLAEAVSAVGTPAILKTRTGGYDGKGQASIEHPDQALEAWDAVDRKPSVLERRLSFTRECSIIVVRGRDGAVESYPLVENEHAGGILRVSIAPADAPSDLVERATGWATELAHSLNHVGTLTLELFDTPDGLIANEFAPRVHNSGHWTIEGCETSQFENHVRAVMGWQLGSTRPRRHTVMLNLVGSMPSLGEVLAIRGAHWHGYGKQPKPGRKIGHITCEGEDPAVARAVADQVRRVIRRTAESRPVH